MSSQEKVIGYSWYMAAGNNDLDIGKFADAVIAFDEAASKANSAHESACAYQMQGVALRLNKQYSSAHVAFGVATSDAIGNDQLRFRIMRDEAHVLMDEGYLRSAVALLKSSSVGLRELGDLTESAMSTGFLGRVHLLKGDKREARRLMSEADGVLRGTAKNDTYELNNLIWLMKVVKPYERRVLLPRALRLIKQTGQRRRLPEVAILVVGGNWLYNYVEALCRRRSGN